MVLDDVQSVPANGWSVAGNPLIPLADIDNCHWRKICTYQYPSGHLKQPSYREVPPKEKLVSIIIPTAGRKQLLKQCIDSIFSHTTTPFELIIVDNGSSDGTFEMVKAEMKVRPNIYCLRQSENLGFQKAVNIGIDKSKGKYVMLFNDDAWVEGREADGRDWLEVYIDELRADQTLGLVGPHGCDSPALGTKMLFFWCVMFRREVFNQVGPLDDITFKNYGGDDDYCERIRAAGFKIKDRVTKLRHLMTCVPDNIKKPELAESEAKLKAKYASRK
jgi:glycosyltransferase involved in cell wall biosynthesis